jgi:SAM-dependent methyltransferase
MYFDAHPGMLRPGMRILHVAPEPSITEVLKSKPGVEYCGGDLERRFGPLYIDVMDINFPDATFDGVVCNHVLEHVPDDQKALREIRRVLKPSGWAILLIPSIRGETTIEDATVTDSAERERLFGQHDHFRWYGWDYLQRLESAGLTPEVFKAEEHWSADAIERLRLRGSLGIDPIFVGRAGTAGP